MIIYDTPNHKIDAEFVPDGQGVTDPWLQISVFHLKGGNEWVTKLLRLSPDALCKLLRYVSEHQYAEKAQELESLCPKL